MLKVIAFFHGIRQLDTVKLINNVNILFESLLYYYVLFKASVVEI